MQWMERGLGLGLNARFFGIGDNYSPEQEFWEEINFDGFGYVTRG